MGEKIRIRQDSDFITEIWTSREPESEELVRAVHIEDLNPYGMLLAGLGSCTAIVLHTYAQNHGIDLKEVELELEYQRIFANDCRDCEGITDYREEITESIRFIGKLSEKDREKLYKVSHHCPIQKIIEGGVAVRSGLDKHS